MQPPRLQRYAASGGRSTQRSNAAFPAPPSRRATVAAWSEKPESVAHSGLVVDAPAAWIS